MDETRRVLTRWEHQQREALIRATQRRVRTALLAERIDRDSPADQQLDADSLDAIDAVCRKLI